MHFNYVKSHEVAGLNDLILRSHPGGALLEIGGGVTPRFPTVPRDKRPTIINIDITQDNPTGDFVIPANLETLADGLHDHRLQPLFEEEGVGTVVMCFVLADLAPTTIQTMIRSAAEKVLNGGNIWMMGYGEKQMAGMVRRAAGRSAVEAGRNRDKITQLAVETAATDEVLADIARECEIHRAVLLPLMRKDGIEKLKTPTPDPAMRALWAQTEAGRLHFVLDDQEPDSSEVWVDTEPTHMVMRNAGQRITVISKGKNVIVEEGWNELLQKKGQVIALYRQWLKTKRKKGKR